VEPNQSFGSDSNVILMRQTCGQRPSRVAGSKRRALAFYFSVRICYMFPKSKCRGESNLGQCMTSVLGKRMRLRSADFRRIMRRNTFFNLVIRTSLQNHNLSYIFLQLQLSLESPRPPLRVSPPDPRSEARPPDPIPDVSSPSGGKGFGLCFLL